MFCKSIFNFVRDLCSTNDSLFFSNLEFKTVNTKFYYSPNFKILTINSTSKPRFQTNSFDVLVFHSPHANYEYAKGTIKLKLLMLLVLSSHLMLTRIYMTIKRDYQVIEFKSSDLYCTFV